MSGIGEEANIFIQAVLSGFVVMGIYDMIRIFRRILSHNLTAVTLEDLFVEGSDYISGISLYLSVKIYLTSDGSIRWFFVTGTLAGVSLFAAIFSQMRKIYKKIKKSIEKKRETH